MVGWGVWRALQPRSTFVVKVVNGVPRVTQGNVTRAFLSSVGDACRHHGVIRGTIRGQAQGNQVSLDFHGDFPAPCRQQLRNIWVMSGWAGGRSRRVDGMSR